MKLLVTHVNPHLDDICGVWLYRKFVPGWQKSRIHFISTSANGVVYGKKAVDADSEIVHVGVGRGKYDEHKGNIGQSAATLVLADLKKRKLLPKDHLLIPALQKVVDYVLDGDLGLRTSKDSIYEVGAVVQWIIGSEKRLKAGEILLDALLLAMKDRVQLELDWKKKKIFNTKWGKGVGIVSSVRGAQRAYEEGFVLLVQLDPKLGYRSIRANARSRVDLSQAFARAKKAEPPADWYLHHSKRMLICGSDVAPQSNLSKLTLDQLIGLVVG